MDLLAERGRRISVRRAEHHAASRACPQAGGSAQARRRTDRRCGCPPLRERALQRHPALHGERSFQAVDHGGRGQTDRGSIVPTNAGFIQDMGGRVTRYPLRRSEKTAGGKHRDVQLGERWMDAMSVDYSCLFPTGMLNIGMHPQKEMEVDLCWAYNRWVTEKVLPEADGRMYSMLCLPFSDPAESLRQ